MRILFFLFLAWTASAAGPPLAYWAMDEGSGSTITSSVASSVGTLQNGVVWGQGIFGRGLSFDGTNDYVSFVTMTNIPDAQVFSMSLFVRTLDHNRRQEIYWEGATRPYLSLSLTSDNLLLLYSRADAELIAQNTVPIPMGHWAHVAITVTNLGATRQVKFYINGNLTDTVSTDGELYLVNGPAFLGAGATVDSTNGYHLSRFFYGELDALRFYSNTLSAVEVAALSTENTRSDLLAPARFSLKPSGVQHAMMSVTPIALATDESCECRYSLTTNTAFTDMSISFTSRFGNTIHETLVAGVTNGQSFTAHVKCRDTNGNANVDDRLISFSVTNSQTAPVSGYFIATNGSDSNPGSLALPWATFAKAGTVMVAGDTLYVRAGVYVQLIYDGANSGTSLSNPISYRNYPGERPWLIPTNDNNVVRFDTSSNIVVDGLVLDAVNGVNSEIPVAKVTFDAHDIRFTNCELKNSLSGHGIQMSGPRGERVEVINCDIHDNGNLITDTQNHGVYLSASNCLIENSRFWNNAHWQVHGFGERSDNTVVRGNTFYDSEGAILVSNGDNWKILNNVIFNPNLGAGIEIRSLVSNTKIYNNTIGGCAIGITISDFGITVEGTKITNNIIYDCYAGGLLISAAGSNTVVRYNIISQSPTLNGSSFYDVGSNTTAALNLIDGTYDPLFVNPFESNFHIRTGSVAIDAGVTLADVPQDIDQHSRPQGAAYDLGSSEYGTVGGALDNQAPTVPASLAFSALTPGTISLSWTASSDDAAVTGYRIYRDHVRVADVASVAYSDLGLPTASIYSYSVSAFDARGNFSPVSSAVSATSLGMMINISGTANVGTITIP